MDVLAQVKAENPQVPPPLWDDIQAVLLAWNRAQSWCQQEIRSESIARFAQLLAAHTEAA